MIALVHDRLPSFVSGNEPLSGRLMAWWEAYRDTDFAHFSRTERDGCLALLDAQAIVCAPPEDAEEIAAFLQLQPQVRSVYTNLPAVITGRVRCFTAMRADFAAQAIAFDEVKLPSLYEFLSGYFDDLPPFEAWYLDVAYRTRHALCRQAVICDGERIASSAMTVAEWQGGALIGGVATAPEHRRKGLAGRCVSGLAGVLQTMGKTVWICPYNEAAHRLYRELGFTDQGSVTVIERMS